MCDKGLDVTWSYKAHKVSRIWPFASLRLTLHGCAEAQAWPCRSSCCFVHAAVQVEKVPDAMLSVVCNESLAVRTQGTRILVLQNATRSTSNLFNRSCHTFGKISSRSSYVKYTVYHSVYFWDHIIGSCSSSVAGQEAVAPFRITDYCFYSTWMLLNTCNWWRSAWA